MSLFVSKILNNYYYARLTLKCLTRSWTKAYTLLERKREREKERDSLSWVWVWTQSEHILNTFFPPLAREKLNRLLTSEWAGSMTDVEQLTCHLSCAQGERIKQGEQLNLNAIWLNYHLHSSCSRLGPVRKILLIKIYYKGFILKDLLYFTQSVDILV